MMDIRCWGTLKFHLSTIGLDFILVSIPTGEFANIKLPNCIRFFDRDSVAVTKRHFSIRKHLPYFSVGIVHYDSFKSLNFAVISGKKTSCVPFS